MRRRPINVLSLSFLDVMSCGFGAAVLFFVIITAISDQSPAAAMTSTGDPELRAERMRAVRDLARVQFELEEAEREQSAAAADSQRLVSAIEAQSKRLSILEDDTLAQQERIEKLKADLEAREKQNERLSAASVTPDRDAASLTRFAGDGRRQYLTSLKLDGRRLLILVDTSASMLDQTIVNVLRRRNMERSRQLQAPKWKRAVATVAWLAANIEPGTQFQIYSFDTEARPVLEDTAGNWIEAGDGTDLQRAVDALRATVPSGGTNFHAAFDVAKQLNPKPDNIFFLVDGLPTRGRGAPTASTVSAKQRLDHFRNAVGGLGQSAPFNVILFPMEGDPLAAGALWELAQVTGGSFMAPSKDWP